MKMKAILITILSLFLLAPVARAESWLSCPGLDLPSSYKGRESLEYLVPGVKDWLFISKKDFMQDFSLKPESVPAFKAFQAALKAKGTDLVLVVVPQRGLVHGDKIDKTQPRAKEYDIGKARESYTAMIAQLAAAGLTVAGAPDFAAMTDYGYPRDHHWNAAGASVIAAKTAEVIKTLPSYRDLPKQEYALESGKDIDFRGSYFRPLKDICGVTLAPHKIKEQVAVLKKGELFTESNPQVTLVGTSFSEEGKSFANFAGQVRAALLVDIDNQSIGAGGPSTSLMGYLKSESFKTAPAKILIWEIPGFYSLNRKELLEDAMAALAGTAK